MVPEREGLRGGTGCLPVHNVGQLLKGFDRGVNDTLLSQAPNAEDLHLHRAHNGMTTVRGINGLNHNGPVRLELHVALARQLEAECKSIMRLPLCSTGCHAKGVAL